MSHPFATSELNKWQFSQSKGRGAKGPSQGEGQQGEAVGGHNGTDARAS